MRIVVDINHPSDVHVFKNFIWEMRKRGHEVTIMASHKDITTQLLQNYGLDFIDLGSYGNSLWEKLFNIPSMDLKMYLAIKKKQPEILLGFASLRAAHSSFLLRVPSIIIDDTEHAVLEHNLYRPFADTILTPLCFQKGFGKKQKKFNGYKELAALHPNWFHPDPKVLPEFELKANEPFIIVRFVSWQANHDIGQYGIYDKVGFVRALEKYGRVIITSEGELPNELKDIQIKTSPEKLHHLLYYSALYIGEGATTATEAAVLGTPAIYISSLSNKLGYIIELEQRYDLLYAFTEVEPAIKKAEEILHDTSSKEKWQIKKEKMINDKIDVTNYLIQFTEQYAPDHLEKGNVSNNLP